MYYTLVVTYISLDGSNPGEPDVDIYKDADMAYSLYESRIEDIKHLTKDSKLYTTATITLIIHADIECDVLKNLVVRNGEVIG